MENIKKILEKVACKHEWESLVISNKYEDDDSKLPYKTTFIFSCRKCGKMKRIVIH